MTARLHLMFGLAGSGKSTLARHLAEARPAVRFTLDEWMIHLYPELSIDDDVYGRRADRVRELIWVSSEQVLRMGCEVVLDWNFWSRRRRAWAVDYAATLGASVTLHHLTTSVAESSARAALRWERAEVPAHQITAEGNAALAELMEPPLPEEGFEVITHPVVTHPADESQ